jgi:hypothetical protein
VQLTVLLEATGISYNRTYSRRLSVEPPSFEDTTRMGLLAGTTKCSGGDDEEG